MQLLSLIFNIHSDDALSSFVHKQKYLKDYMSNNFVMTAVQKITLLVRFTHYEQVKQVPTLFSLAVFFRYNEYYTAKCLNIQATCTILTKSLRGRRCKVTCMHIPYNLPFIEHFLKVITFCVSVPVCKG